MKGRRLCQIFCKQAKLFELINVDTELSNAPQSKSCYSARSDIMHITINIHIFLATSQFYGHNLPKKNIYIYKTNNSLCPEWCLKWGVRKSCVLFVRAKSHGSYKCLSWSDLYALIINVMDAYFIALPSLSCLAAKINANLIQAWKFIKLFVTN